MNRCIRTFGWQRKHKFTVRVGDYIYRVQCCVRCGYQPRDLW